MSDTDTTQLRLLVQLLAMDWLDNDREHADTIEKLAIALAPSAGPPVNVDAPYAEQQGSGTNSLLNCTIGIWGGAPTTYAYQWQRGNTNIGTNSSSYTVAPADVGKTVTCVVTATNDLGPTAASSNGVNVV